MWKKLLTLVMALALVATSITYTPKSVDAAQSDAAAYDWDSVSWVGDANTGNANTFKLVLASGSGSLVNIQQPGFANEAGMYITFADAAFGDFVLNGTALNSSQYAVQGAGVVFYVSAFTAMYNELTVQNTSGGSKAVFYIYNKNGTAGGGNSSETTTEATEEPSQAEETTAQSQVSGTGTIDGAFHSIVDGGWQYLAGTSTSSLSYTGGSSMSDGPTFTVTKSSWVEADFQAKTPVFTATTAGTHSITFTNLEDGDTTQTYINVCDATSGDVMVTTYNNKQAITRNVQATYEAEIDLTVGQSIYVVYVQNYSSAGTKQLACTIEGPGSSEPTALAAPTKVVGYDFYALGTGYQVNFIPGDELAVSYNLYIDDVATPIATFTPEDLTVVDSKKGTVAPANFPASTFSTYADDNVHDIYVEAVDSEGNTAKSKAGKMRIVSSTTAAKVGTDPTDISRVYITTSNATSLDTYNGDTKEQSKQDASLVIISGDSKISSASHYGTVKLRGNSTAFADKKAYNISFNDKKTVINGAAKGKKWCLLANAYEKTLIRNKMAMDFGAKLGNVATPMEYYTDVYVNGTYKGTYVISEPADNGRAGVSYDEDGNDLAIELEQNEKDESQYGAAYVQTTRLGRRFCTEDLEDNVLALYESGTTSIADISSSLAQSSTKFSKMIDTLNSFETALVNTSSTAYLDYIDVDSFVDMYIINELFQTVDFNYSSVKFYITYSGDTPTIHAGPLWDFDLSSGNSSASDARTYNTMRGQNNTWFNYLMRHTDFAERVKTKYQSMQGYIQNLYQDNSKGTNQIDANVALMGQSRVRNYTSAANGGAGWSETNPDSAEWNVYAYSYSTISPYSTYTYSQHIEYLRDWLQNRNEYLVNAWGLTLDYTDEDEITTSSDLDIKGYQMTAYQGGNAGSIGSRVIYQIGDTVNGEVPTSFGLVYGLSSMAGTDYELEDSDMVANGEKMSGTTNLIYTNAGSETGNVSALINASDGVEYYAQNMPLQVNGTVSADMINATIYVRAYAELDDGTYVYSDIYTYRVFDIADYLYQNRLLFSQATHNYIYNLVLKVADPTYTEVDYLYDDKMALPTKKS